MLKRYFLILNGILIVIVLGLIINISLSFARAGKVILPKMPSPLPVKEKIEEGPKPYDYYSVILEKDLFGGVTGEEVPEGVLPETLPNLNLKGTIIGEGTRSLCIIADLTTRKEELYSIGDLVSGYEIVEIKRNHILLKTPDGLKSLVIYEEKGPLLPSPSKVSGLVKKLARNRYRVSMEELTKTIENPSQLLTQARVTPHLVAGQIAGFKISEVKRGSIVESLGVQEGDIIKGIGGEKLDSIEKAIQTYKKMQGKPVVSVEVERDGRPVTLTYEIR